MLVSQAPPILLKNYFFVNPFGANWNIKKLRVRNA
jgi:hypothetical protein